MPTNIYKYDGTLLTTVADATLDTTHSTLKFPGTGYKRYSEPVMENLVWIMQNFAGAIAPTNPITGQGWYDTSKNILRVYNGASWDSASGIQVGTSKPVTGTNVGSLFYDSVNKQFYIWNGTAWDLLGPMGSATNSDPVSPTIPTNSAIESIRISDGTTNHQVWRVTIGGTILAILSTDQAFTPLPTLTGFPTIYPGLTLNTSIANSTIGGTTLAFSGTKSNFPVSDVTYDLGTSARRFKNFWADAGRITSNLTVNTSSSGNTFEVTGVSKFNGPVNLTGSYNNPAIIINTSNLAISQQRGAMEFDGNNFYITSNVQGSTTRFAVGPGADGNFYKVVNISNVTQSNSSTTGALVVTGGAGVGGNVYVNGNMLMSGAFTQFFAPPNGTSITPSISWASDKTTGLFNPSSGNIALAMNGVERLRINSQGAINLNNAGYGNPGQVLASQGFGLPAIWAGLGGNVTTATSMISSSFNEAKGADIISGATTNIWANADGNLIYVTGAGASITSLGTAPQAGARRTLIFAGVNTLTYNATTLVLPGSASISTAAGDVATVVADTTANMVVTSYTRATGQPIIPNFVGAWASFYWNGSAVVIVASYNVSGITHNGTSDFTVSFTTSLASANYVVVGANSDTATSTSGSGIRVIAASAGAAPTLKSSSQVRIGTGAADPGASNAASFAVIGG
jgi:hypothetical protein